MAIVRFTNSRGEINYGRVIATDPSGMVCVEWEPFSELLARLERAGPVRNFVRAGLSWRVSWIRVEGERPYGAKMELLPDDHPMKQRQAPMDELQLA